MNKYDMMIACNRKTSEEKVNRAVTEIRQMLTDREKVTVPKLVKRTGLSRGFFYKNETVRKEMDRALEQQAGMIDPKRYIGDIVMKNRIELLEQQVRELKREKEQLEKENIRLQKALNKNDRADIFPDRPPCHTDFSGCAHQCRRVCGRCHHRHISLCSLHRFQLPGYYKLGSIKGRVFMYIPVAGFLATLLLIAKLPAGEGRLLSAVIHFPVLLMLSAVIFVVAMYAISILVSIKILKNKEM